MRFNLYIVLFNVLWVVAVGELIFDTIAMEKEAKDGVVVVSFVNFV